MYIVISLIFPCFHMEPSTGHESNITRPSRASQCKIFLGSSTDGFLKTSHLLIIVATYLQSQPKILAIGSHCVPTCDSSDVHLKV